MPTVDAMLIAADSASCQAGAAPTATSTGRPGYVRLPV